MTIKYYSRIFKYKLDISKNLYRVRHVLFNKKRSDKLGTLLKSSKLEQSGFSLVEVLLASSIFVLLVTAVAGSVIYGQEATRTAGTRQRASSLANEGIEAVRNIRDANFSNIVNGTYGLAEVSNKWALTGSSDTTDSLFTRQITISDGVDANTKNVNVTVSWQQTPQRLGTVSYQTILTNWRAVAAPSEGSNLLIYGNGSTNPLFRKYDSSANTFSTASAAGSAASGTSYGIRTSPTKNEAIAGYVTSGGVLQVMCYNGSSWSNEWSVNVGGTATTKRFDIAYETNSGDVMVLYSQNVTTTNELGYRTKSGTLGCGASNWSGATNLNPLRTSGTVHWVKMAWDRRASSDLIAAIWADSNSDLSTMIWSGTAWVNEPSAASETSLEIVATAQDVDDFDIEYESLSGDILMVWANSAGGNGTNGVRYRTCPGGLATCTWGAVTTPPTFADDAQNLDISANPDSDQMVFASIGSAGSDMQAGYWSGTAWTNTANLDTSCNAPIAGSRKITTGWLVSGALSRSIIVYDDNGSTAINWVVGNLNSFVIQTDFSPSPAPTNSQGWIDVNMSQNEKNTLLLAFADNNSDLFAKRLVMNAAPTFTWTNSDGVVLDASLPQKISSPFSFAFRRF